jgi:hypothetical protein
MSAFPTGIRVTRFSLQLNENVARTESLFTRRSQVVTLAGGTADRWEGVLETEPLDWLRALPMTAFLAAVGIYGTFTVVDPMNPGVTSGQSTCLVNGAGQTGTTLNVDGLPNGTLIAKAGEYFQVGSEYKILTADATSNGSGQVNGLQFKPALRASPADNAVVTFAAAALTLRLTSIPAKDPDQNRLHVFSLSFEEAL